MATKVLKCTCSNGFQDSRYGDNMRVHNSCGPENNKYRCTVCSTEHSPGESSPKKKK